MSDHPRTQAHSRRSAFADLFKLDDQIQAPGAPGVYIEEKTDIGIIVLRGQTGDAGFLDRATQVLGLQLPTEPCKSVRVGQTNALWIGPDEWWILCPLVQTRETVRTLEAALDGLFAQVIDNSAGLGVLQLSGGNHLMLLRHLCPYPVESIEPEQCISTVLPKTNITLVGHDNASILLISRRSYAHWISELLKRSARPYGLALRTSDAQV